MTLHFDCNKRVLVTGLTALDIVYSFDSYPAEGSYLEARHQTWRKGGNAANTAGVLGKLLVKVDLFSVLANNYIGKFVSDELKRSGVNLDRCVSHTDDNGMFPTSVCLLSKGFGTRSVVHCRNNFPPLNFKHFQETIICEEYSWFHFEERCCSELEDVIYFIRDNNSEGKVSIELEKPKRFETVTKNLMPIANVIFLSKEIAKFLGYSSHVETVSNIRVDLGLRDDQVVICPWGDLGAAAIDTDGCVYQTNAFVQTSVVDTLGAGDTFIAGVIFCLNKGESLGAALEFGCKLAGKKCGVLGFDEIVTDI